MGELVKVCRVSDLPDPGKAVFDVDGRMIAVFHVSGTFWAIDDVCTHDGGPLAEGELRGYTIICPRHGAQFDIRTGHAKTMPAVKGVTAHKVVVQGEDVYIEVNESA
ncbi:non-heme iron oxygenase ferredoxin subunit [Thermogutta sp.]|jgi:3-phenylpropionate/trans-cinnamate dioxygenase ferredoxin subunit|uniref:Rieske (2Fe-2S) protein n=1 Tax=Thermogutta sp. TaxID=1962930 RepID=UPI00321FA49A